MNKGSTIRILLLCTAAIFCSSCDGGTSGPDPIPILGECNLEPNYIAEVGLNRWRDFPLRFFLDESTFPDANRDLVLGRVLEGLHQWAASTNGGIGSVVRITSTEDANFFVLAEDLPDASARTTHAGGSPFLFGGRIVFDRSAVVELSNSDEERFIATLAAHEMGHLLGIIGHTSTDGHLMSSGSLATEPTTADLNTLSHAYCHP